MDKIVFPLSAAQGIIALPGESYGWSGQKLCPVSERGNRPLDRRAFDIITSINDIDISGKVRSCDRGQAMPDLDRAVSRAYDGDLAHSHVLRSAMSASTMMAAN